MKMKVGVVCLCMIVTGYLGYLLLSPPPALVHDPLVRRQMEESLQSPPLQTPTSRASFAYKEFRLSPRAEYDITARVFSTRRYHWNMVDPFYRISPEDLALGWGPLSDYANKEKLHIRQEDRWFKYRYRGPPPYPRDVMIASMANTHIVPASDKVARDLKDIRAGDIVHLTGALIDITLPGKGTISTSLTRTDTGPGACEVMWLESVEIER